MMRKDLPGRPRLHPVVFFFVALIGLVFLFHFSAPQAQASLIHCRTDPIVTLSNGDVVIIAVDISADPSQVQRIDYTLHVPNNVTAINVMYIDSAPGLVESFTLKNDFNDGYKSETIARTSTSVGVSVTMSVGSTIASVTDKSGKKLTAVIKFDN